MHRFIQFPERAGHEDWAPSLIYVVRIPRRIMPLFPDIINRAGVSFHVFWWKVTINQACFWAGCKTSTKFDSQSKNVLVEWLGLHHGGAAKETQTGEPPLPIDALSCSKFPHVSSPRGCRTLKMCLQDQATLLSISASALALLSSKRIVRAGVKEVCFGS